MIEQLLRLRDVEAKIVFSKSWIYRKIKTGGSAPIHLDSSARWKASGVQAWIESRTAT